VPVTVAVAVEVLVAGTSWEAFIVPDSCMIAGPDGCMIAGAESFFLQAVASDRDARVRRRSFFMKSVEGVLGDELKMRS
jgi:hypothetical protein